MCDTGLVLVLMVIVWRSYLDLSGNSLSGTLDGVVQYLVALADLRFANAQVCARNGAVNEGTPNDSFT